MGKGTRQMLLACLIPAARPREPASGLAVGNGTCFPSLSAVMGQHCKRRRAELCGHLGPRGIHAPIPLHILPKTSIFLQGWGFAGNKSCSSPLPNSGRLGELPKPSVMPELLMQGRSPPPTLEHPGCQLQPLHIPMSSGGSTASKSWLGWVS